MSFLSAFIKDKIRITSVREEENESEHSDTAEPVAIQESLNKQNSGDGAVGRSPPPQQKRRMRKSASQENNNSASATLMRYLVENKNKKEVPVPIDTFFSLMATTVKKFSHADQHLIKTKVFSLVREGEGKYIFNQNENIFGPQTQTHITYLSSSITITISVTVLCFVIKHLTSTTRHNIRRASPVRQ